MKWHDRKQDNILYDATMCCTEGIEAVSSLFFVVAVPVAIYVIAVIYHSLSFIAFFYAQETLYKFQNKFLDAPIHSLLSRDMTQTALSVYWNLEN